ncbi:hypothetical protein FIBSPDRAFT_69846 [Athelia psychrophila]|uniref:Uncharacterized protein n=1 Tax=Athelia psychrophila TaxID=1759441 RepID=A0A166TT10_9AGAM|nr:hypothetical protein FIBSPDRAFT_69846 [Fibularhizoctonia sp. CBS 109695]
MRWEQFGKRGVVSGEESHSGLTRYLLDSAPYGRRAGRRWAGVCRGEHAWGWGLIRFRTSYDSGDEGYLQSNPPHNHTPSRRSSFGAARSHPVRLRHVAPTLSAGAFGNTPSVHPPRKACGSTIHRHRIWTRCQGHDHSLSYLPLQRLQRNQERIAS